MKCPNCEGEMNEQRRIHSVVCSNFQCLLFDVSLTADGIEHIKQAIAAARQAGYAQAREQAALLVIDYQIDERGYCFGRECEMSATIANMQPEAEPK